MNQRPTIREQMDACRPDSDDLLLPEHAADLAELQAAFRDSAEVRGTWEKSQQDGRIIQSAMQDVSLPAGLEARLLAAVQAADDAPPVTPAAQPAVKNRVPQRRQFLQVAGLVAVAASAMVAFVSYQNWPQPPQEISKDQLASRVEDWLRHVDVRTMVKPPKAMSPPGGVFGTVSGSSTIASSQGTITAYSVKLRGGSSATLLAIPTSQQYPVGTLPFTKVSGISGGWIVGAWQKNGVLYVIAVTENSGARLDQFVPLQPIG